MKKLNGRQTEDLSSVTKIHEGELRGGEGMPRDREQLWLLARKRKS